MAPVVLVALGGATGAVARYLLALSLSRYAPILLINIGGCFLAGILMAILQQQGESSQSESLRLLLMTGFLGGFTTFSAFAHESFRLLYGGITLQAAGYVLASVLGSLLAYGLGCVLGQTLVRL